MKLKYLLRNSDNPSNIGIEHCGWGWSRPSSVLFAPSPMFRRLADRPTGEQLRA